MIKTWLDLLHICRYIVARFREDRCAQMAASLTFTTLLSLVPLITIALTLFSAFPVFAEFSDHIKNFLLSNMLPETGGKLITRYVEQFAESAAKLTTVGLMFLGFTAMMMMLTIDHAFNTIWRVSRQRPLIQRVLIYWAVLTLAPLLVGGSLSLTSWLVGISVGYASQISQFGVELLRILPVMLTTLAFSLLFRVVPNRFVPLRHAIAGGVVAAILFELMNRFFAYYIAHFPTYKLVYGAFASVPIFLMWVYLSWLTILLGALIAASLSHWRGHKAKNISPVEQLYFALQILKMMNEGLKSGKVQELPDISRKLHLGFDMLELILERLSKIDVVRKLDGRGWVMIRDVNHIKVDELFRLFVFDSARLESLEKDSEIITAMSKVQATMDQASAKTIREFLAG